MNQFTKKVGSACLRNCVAGTLEVPRH
jgi:hypothetical protein